VNSRETAYNLLLRVERDKAYSTLALKNAQTDPFTTALFYGVLERMLTLDFIIARFSKTKASPEVRVLLRIALYQLLYMEVPESAAVNETVALAPKYAKGYVNAVLRNFLRSDKSFLEQADLSVKYSCPDWLISKWIAHYGEDSTLQILQTSLKKPPAFKRFSPFNAELFHIQDLSSQKACELLNPKPGDVVLDLCAAPGGKAFTLAELMNNMGRVIACDINAKRLPLIEKEAKRLGLGIIETLRNDAAVFNPNLPMADKVLCDAPCSGFGVIRRKPEIKYKKESDIAGLPAVQAAILATSANYVKPGGTLMYSTCTLNKDENESIVDNFMRGRSDFELMSMNTTIPSEDGGDGFFTAIMRRICQKI